MMCCQGVSFPGRQSHCSTQTLSNWTNSPRPYCSMEEPLRHGTAPPPSVSFTSSTKHYTPLPPPLGPPTTFPTPGHQRRMRRCQKNGAHILVLSCFSMSNLTKLLTPLVTSSVTTTVRHVQYHSRSLMSTFWVPGLSSQPQALVSRAYIIQI